MRTLFILAFFAFCAVHARHQTPVKPVHPCHCKCGPNEIYKKCGGCDGCCGAPKPCCGDMKGPPGCYCKKGYVRDQWGHCIPVCKCPKCKCNEEWKCGNCDGTVKDPKKKCCCVCRMGCFCKCGFVRNCKGECVPAKCHKKKFYEQDGGDEDYEDEGNGGYGGGDDEEEEGEGDEEGGEE